MMTYKEFCNTCKENVEVQLSEAGGKYDVSLTTVLKNNGLEKVGIVMKQEDQSLAPTLYLEEHYEKYTESNGRMSMEDMAKELIKIQERAIEIPEIRFKMEDFNTFEKVKPMLEYRLVNAKMNKQKLKSVPVKYVSDLAAIYVAKLPVKDADSCASFTINNDMLKQWGVSVEELDYVAEKNSFREENVKLYAMEDIIFSMGNPENILDTPFEEGNLQYDMSHMYILTNQDKMYGASMMMNVDKLSEIEARLGQGFYILPSSTHESILVPKSDFTNPKELAEMVTEINGNVVDKEDKLSDNVYTFNSKEQKLEIAAKGKDREKSQER